MDRLQTIQKRKGPNKGEKGGLRFSFGQNWVKFSKILDEKRIAEAEKSLKLMLDRESLQGLSFLDVGSGSGLFSLCAARLGASTVYSFDYDPGSVSCTAEIKKRFFPSMETWTVERGDVLDENYLNELGLWDIVYSWGVLHHTGNMWKALENCRGLVKEGGLLYIALYNDQGFLSVYWKFIKTLYNRSPHMLKKLFELGFAVYFTAGMFAADVLRARNPITRYSGKDRRGMGIYRDVVDWIGGYPFEVADPNEVVHVFKKWGFESVKLTTCGKKHGCNEFVFRKKVQEAK